MASSSARGSDEDLGVCLEECDGGSCFHRVCSFPCVDVKEGDQAIVRGVRDDQEAAMHEDVGFSSAVHLPQIQYRVEFCIEG